jgi:hypothetical protein
MKSSSSLLLGAALVSVGTASVSAQIYAYEPFDYDLTTYMAYTVFAGNYDTLNSQVLKYTSLFTGDGGLNGGVGWSTGWESHSSQTGDYGSLMPGMGYTDGLGNSLLTSGLSLRIGGTDPVITAPATSGTGLNASWYRILSDPSAVTASTYYVSFLLERRGESDEATWGSDPDGNPYTRVVQGSLISDNPQAGRRGSEFFTIGGGLSSLPPEDVWMFQSDNYASASFSGTRFSSNQQFVVLRVDPGAGTDGTDFVSLYLNPLLHSEGANTPAWQGDIWTDTNVKDEFGNDVLDPDTGRPIKEIVPYNMLVEGFTIVAGGGRFNLDGSIAEAAGEGLFDEIRFAGSWADAAPVDGLVVIPEPRAFALLFGLAATMGALLRRRR